MLAIRRKGLGEDSLQVARTLQNRGVVQTKAGRFRGVGGELRAGAAAHEGDPGSRITPRSRRSSQLGKLKKAEKDYTAAERLYRQSLDLRLRKLGEEHPDVATVRFDLGSLLVLDRRYAEAEPLLVKARDAREKLLGKDAAPTRAAAEELAKVRAARVDAKSAQ